jgi:hypothetical protein
MAAYAVDSKRQGMRATGIVSEVMEWEERDGRRRPSETQARDDATGMPLWAVEVIYRQSAWGRESNTTGTVTVGSPVKPVVEEFAPITFAGLAVQVRVNKAGALVETWAAGGLADAKRAPSTGSGSSSGSG